MSVTIRQVPASATLHLRRQVLRPWLQEADCAFNHDSDPESVHLLAESGDEVLGVASILPEDKEGNHSESVFRIRGMAVLESERGRGIGARLLRELLERAARSKNLDCVWCNSRLRAATLYARQGFFKTGEPFELPDIGPHVTMEIPASKIRQTTETTADA